MYGKILIADDDLGLAEVLAMRCEAAGLETIVVDNAQCALLAILSEQPDVAVLDLNMPAANDGDVLELLATDPELSQTPVIILTGQKDHETIERCRSLMVHYIPKQRNVWIRLKRTIEQLLTRRECSGKPRNAEFSSTSGILHHGFQKPSGDKLVLRAMNSVRS
ncbi:response regulator [Fuerstiella marisgermanici]|uniref:DNA-binding response regulator MtrA n=1 Tax=Fuerstiella marisgermanici TaxID=1891926 RepID=A0A1P8WAB3_9PLAN|nr:response regulator [Fuerstiella marisgermanici]APZ90996.1 DNA-binding response regulator MtrA [Fuerstiella marisgermanici]